MTGRPATFVQGLDFGYLFQQGPDNYVDVIGADGGTLVYADQSDSGRVVSHQDSGYRTILSTVIYGALQGSDRTRLMDAYVRYLLTGAPITDVVSSSIGRFAIGPNPVLRGQALHLTAPADTHGRLKVYDAAGRLVLTTPFRGSTAVADQLPAGAFVARIDCSSGGLSLPFTVVH